MADKTREQKLEEAQREQHRLKEQRKPIITEVNRSKRKLRKINSEISKVGQRIYNLKHDGDVPEITDHAIVRYLERVKGVDILELKAEVANHKSAHKKGNVIVTVNEEKE